MNSISSNDSLISNILGRSSNNIFYILYSSFIGSILLAISSKIQIPLAPVPVTMQTMILLVISMFLGWKAALGASLMYIFEGLIGLPVFAKMNGFIFGGGINYLLQPTGGYIIGFVFAAPAVGYLSQRNWDKSIIFAFISFFIGTVIIFVFGLSWLTFVFYKMNPQSVLIAFYKALAVGFVPFIYFELLKISLGACIVLAGWELKEKYLDNKI